MPMTKFTLFRLKNWMIFGNLIANFIGINIVGIISHRSIAPPPPEVMDLVKRIDMVFMPMGFLIMIIAAIYYERPIRLYLNNTYRGITTSSEIEQKARRRLLNEPFFLIAIDLFSWLLAALVYPSVIHTIDAGEMIVGRIFFQTLLIGIITTTTAFFILEQILQKAMVPHFFPEGGLYMTSKTLRIRIRERLVALIVASNMIPFLAFLIIIRGTYRSSYAPEQLFVLLRSAIFTSSLIFLGIGALLTFLVYSSLSRPLQEIIQVLKNVRNGRFDKRVRVTSNDEIGYTGDVINEMNEGLIEREKMRQSLDLAMEVQQNLLPRTDPTIEGLDIAGKSIYCDETGGDYYDFIISGTGENGYTGVAIGDVSGHGISSALLMATVRSSLRQRSSLPGSAASIMSDVNRQLVRDVEDSGQFMTLFYLTIDPAKRKLQWVRAGHDPAIFYDPGTDSFEELGGSGIALGVNEDWNFKEYTKTALHKGQIIFLSTDGIWEARNQKGEMFGKKLIYHIIRKNSSLSANEILDAMLKSLNRFQNGAKIEDDITLVVIKIDY